jgi:hypothetical protein
MKTMVGFGTRRDRRADSRPEGAERTHNLARSCQSEV